MRNNQLFNIYTRKNFSSKEEVLSFLESEGHKLTGIDSSEFKTKLFQREEQGSIEIAPGVLLPHFESSSFIKSKVLILSLKQAIQHWSKEICNVKLVIVILLKTEEKKWIKQAIMEFTRKLADDKYLNKLMNLENKNRNEGDDFL